MRQPSDAPRGVLTPSGDADGIVHERWLPSVALAPYVAHFWTVRWDRRGRPPLVVETLPHPCVHLLFERGRAQVAGLSTRLFRRRLQGAARVFGVKFRPAAFHPVFGAPVSRLRDRVRSLASVFGRQSDVLRDGILGEADVHHCVTLATDFLRARLPPMPAATAALRDLVERLAADQTITRVEQAAALAGLDVRRLQRRFSAWVGMSPKWVIQRYRLHEAAEQLARGRADLAGLALRLGYFDQPHFIHSFKALTGRPPGQQALRQGDTPGERGAGVLGPDGRASRAEPSPASVAHRQPSG